MTTTLKATEMKRIFRFNGVTLADPNPEMSVAEVQTYWAAAGHADLNTATVSTEIEDGRMIVDFKRAVGHKG